MQGTPLSLIGKYTGNEVFDGVLTPEKIKL
jgi:hypothetical protein